MQSFQHPILHLTFFFLYEEKMLKQLMKDSSEDFKVQNTSIILWVWFMAV